VYLSRDPCTLFPISLRPIDSFDTWVLKKYKEIKAETPPHQNVLSSYDSFVVEGCLYLCYDYSHTIVDAITYKKDYGTDDVNLVATQIVSALTYFSDPSYIFLCATSLSLKDIWVSDNLSFDSIKITDFADMFLYATTLSSVEPDRTSILCAPLELLRGELVDSQSWLYSLGEFYL